MGATGARARWQPGPPSAGCPARRTGRGPGQKPAVSSTADAAANMPGVTAPSSFVS